MTCIPFFGGDMKQAIRYVFLCWTISCRLCKAFAVTPLHLFSQQVSPFWPGRRPQLTRRHYGNRDRNGNAVDDKIVSLQDPHPQESPSVVLERLAKFCEQQNIKTWDIYGDYAQSADVSFLRRFEQQVAHELGKEDAVFMPSGVMAQSIALLIHQTTKRNQTSSVGADRFICHETSHLLLHEDNAYETLVRMKPVIVSTKARQGKTPNSPSSNNNNNNSKYNTVMNGGNLREGADTVKYNGDIPLVRSDEDETMSEPIETPAMGFLDVLQALSDLQWSESLIQANVAALLVELPHRELGGKITSWDDLIRLQEWCRSRRIAFHCDGARLFEATAAYERTPAEIASLFDSVYLSFYKGLGGMSGAMLCGTTDFCDQARIWVRRFGGNLYTMLPYAVSALKGYQDNWIQTLRDTPTDIGGLSDGNNGNGETVLPEQYSRDDLSQSGKDNPPPPLCMSFVELRDKLRQLVAALSAPNMITTELVRFDPAVPVTNMVHGYLKCTASEGLEWCRWITAETGVQVLRRIRPLPEDSLQYRAGYRSMFEWTMGNANGQVLDEVFYEGWTALAETYLANHAAIKKGESPIEYPDVDKNTSDLAEDSAKANAVGFQGAAAENNDNTDAPSAENAVHEEQTITND